MANEPSIKINSKQITGSSVATVVIGSTIFLSAFLLFVVQPMISKYILPWYGGSPAVWTTCMLFFQTLLLLGYAYAHILTQKFSLRNQVIIHSVLMLVSISQLPPIPSESWKYEAEAEPVLSILVMLFTTIGLPYVVLSATSPLLQRWFSVLSPKVSPYRLYALSNVGSLLALLSFPLLIEPTLTRQLQAFGWGAGMILFIIVCGAVCSIIWRHRSSVVIEEKQQHEPATATSWVARLLWIVFPAVSSMFLLATTNKLCQEIAVIPLLWLLPLALYLLSFIICFENPKWYSRTFFVALFLVFLAGVVWALVYSGGTKLVWIVTLFPGLLFSVSMICHGEVARLKPSSDRLTLYYLSISLGGAFGSVFVVILAPILFTDYMEYHIGILLTIMLLMIVYYTDKNERFYRGKLRWGWIANMILLTCGGIAFVLITQFSNSHVLAQKRNFYGMIKVEEYDLGGERLLTRYLKNGSIVHGIQFMDPEIRPLPTTYYCDESGLGKCFQNYRTEKPLRIGAVGLGVGTVGAWTIKGDTLRLYEINPYVKQFADEYFYFLRDAEATIEYVSGDARLSMEREPAQRYDILILDAFTSEAPPVHLLTTEAFEIYLKHLNKDGVIALHISSKFLDFYPMIVSLARRLNIEQRLIIDDNQENDLHRFFSSWVLLSRNREFMNRNEILSVTSHYPQGDTVQAWTDDFSSLFPILNW